MNKAISFKLLRWYITISTRKPRNTKRVPLYSLRPTLLDTVEGCAACSVLPGSSRKRLAAAFNALPRDVIHIYTDPPKPGEYVPRIHLFASVMRPALNDREYHAAMLAMLRHARNTKAKQAAL